MEEESEVGDAAEDEDEEGERRCAALRSELLTCSSLATLGKT